MSEKPKILVIDDEQVILDAAKRILTAEGYAIETTLDAETALQLLESSRPDIVISDLMLPGMSGFEFLREVRERNPDLVVIITTGYYTVDNAVDSLKQGAFDFLPKPFTFDEIMSPVRRAARYLQLTEGERERTPRTDAPELSYLGLQTWARIDPDGAGVLGLTELFLRTIDGIKGIEFPNSDDELRQGGHLAWISTVDDQVHEVWSPLSGQILMVNPLLEQRPDVPHEDPFDAGWLIRIMPTAPEKERANLSRS